MQQMGNSLHRQREEQNEYFVQKELNLKLKAKFQLANVAGELDEKTREASALLERNDILK